MKKLSVFLLAGLLATPYLAQAEVDIGEQAQVDPELVKDTPTDRLFRHTDKGDKNGVIKDLIQDGADPGAKRDGKTVAFVAVEKLCETAAWSFPKTIGYGVGGIGALAIGGLVEMDLMENDGSDGTKAVVGILTIGTATFFYYLNNRLNKQIDNRAAVANRLFNEGTGARLDEPDLSGIRIIDLLNERITWRNWLLTKRRALNKIDHLRERRRQGT